MFDGLDEIGTSVGREAAKDNVLAFARSLSIEPLLGHLSCVVLSKTLAGS